VIRRAAAASSSSAAAAHRHAHRSGLLRARWDSSVVLRDLLARQDFGKAARNDTGRARCKTGTSLCRGGQAALCAALSQERRQARAGPRARAGTKPAAICRVHRGAPAHRHTTRRAPGELIDLSKEANERHDFAPTPPTSSSTTWRASPSTCDPDHHRNPGKESFPAVLWMRQARRALHRSWGRQAFKDRRRFKFWAG